jgi:hypothetical protein
MTMKSTNDCRMILNGATASSKPNGRSSPGIGEDIEDDYPVCRPPLERSSSKKVPL